MTQNLPTGRALLDRMEASLADLLSAHHVPGCSIAVVQDGGIAGRIAQGSRDADTGQPMTPETILEAASLSKPLFAYGVMKLVERGDLDLDRPLAEYLPEPYLPDEPRLARVTTRMVLTHTTGWPNWRPKGGALRFEHEPGTRFTYSGEGFQYLQHAIGHIVDEPLESYLPRCVLSPLGMSDSSYVWQAAYEKTAASGHDTAGEPQAERHKYTRVKSAASLYTTPTDYARLLLALLEPPPADEHRLTRDSIKSMLRPTWHTQAEVYRALGWIIRCDAAGETDFFFHTGNNPGFKCFAIAWPARRAGAVIMTNGDNGRLFYTQLLERTLGPRALGTCLDTGS